MNYNAMCALVLATLFALSLAVRAEDAGELAEAAQKPVSNLISLPFQNNTDFDFGPKYKTYNALNIQPVLPFEISENWNLITRTIIPVVSQPGILPGDDRETGLGDTSFTAFLSPGKPGTLIWSVGPVLLLPTSTDDRLGADEWGAGSSLVVLTMPGPWVIGTLVSNVWDIDGDTEINALTWQYFVNYNFSCGWYLTSSPVMTANWEAESGEERSGPCQWAAAWDVSSAFANSR
jgi:hypothetical protein